MWNSGLEVAQSLYIEQLEQELIKLKAQLKREQECVDFYANHENWSDFDEPYENNVICNDSDLWDIGNFKPNNVGGKLARETQKMRG